MNAGTLFAYFKGRKAYIYRLQNILPSQTREYTSQIMDKCNCLLMSFPYVRTNEWMYSRSKSRFE